MPLSPVVRGRVEDGGVYVSLPGGATPAPVRDARAEGAAKCSRSAATWSRFTHRFRQGILAVSLAVACGGLPWAGVLLESTDNGSFDVVGSVSHEATQKLARFFPQSAKAESLVLLSDAVDGRTLGDLSPHFCLWERSVAAAIRGKYPPCGGERCFVRYPIVSYCEVAAANATAVALSFVDNATFADSRAAILTVTYGQVATKERNAMINWVSAEAQRLARSHGLGSEALRLGLTGFDVFASAGSAAARSDLETLDTISLPIALIVMALTLGSLTLLLVPLCNMACTTVLEFVIMGQVAQHVTIATFVPSVMMTITLALSFDYSLFICSRYIEARNDGLKGLDRIAVVLHGAGHTILVSGSTLIACLLCFPSDLLRGTGLAVSCGLACAMMFNLTLSPALLHAFGEPLSRLQDALDAKLRRLGKFLARTLCRRRLLPCCCSSKPPPSRWRRHRGALIENLFEEEGESEDDDDDDASGDSSSGESSPCDDSARGGDDGPPSEEARRWCRQRRWNVPPQGESEASRVDRKRARASVWYAGARFLWDDRRVAAFVVLAVVLALAPVCSSVARMRQTADPAAVAPSPSEPERTLRRVEGSFGGGAIAPLTILFEARKNATLANVESFDTMAHVLFTVLGGGEDDHDDHVGTSSKIASVLSLSEIGGVAMKPLDYLDCLGQRPAQRTEFCASALLVLLRSANNDFTAAMATVTLDASPFSTAGFNWIGRAQDRLRADFRSRDHFQGVYIAGTAPVLRDLIASLYASFPLVVASTLGLVFLLLAFAFRSLAVPLRSVAALCLTLSFAFGTCALVYQRPGHHRQARDGEDNHFYSFLVRPLTTRGADPGISWLAPLICFSVIVGLALDYDVFLLARVHEYRVSDRLPDRLALLCAVEKTGVIITSAGMIMAISFGGLFLSTTTILNQTAWLLCSAVLFDTFVVRTFVMPSLCSLSRSYIFWPAKLPTPVDPHAAPATSPLNFTV